MLTATVTRRRRLVRSDIDYFLRIIIVVVVDDDDDDVVIVVVVELKLIDRNSCDAWILDSTWITDVQMRVFVRLLLYRRRYTCRGIGPAHTISLTIYLFDNYISLVPRITSSPSMISSSSPSSSLSSSWVFFLSSFSRLFFCILRIDRRWMSGIDFSMSGHNWLIFDFEKSKFVYKCMYVDVDCKCIDEATVESTQTRAIIMFLFFMIVVIVLTNFNGFDSTVVRRVSTTAISFEMEIYWALALIDSTM